MKSDYICAICGAGKTTDAIRYISKAIHEDQCFIIFQPTTELNKTTYEGFDHELRSNGTVKVINHESLPAGQTVIQTLHEVLNQPGKCRVIITTFEAAVRLKRRWKMRWHAIVDEALEAYTTSSIQSKLAVPLLLKLIEFSPSEHADYLKVTIRKGQENALMKLAQDARTDRALKILEETADALLKNMSTYVSTHVYDAFSKYNNLLITFHHILMPRVFSQYRSLTMMAAHFEESLLYRVWKGKYGVRFTRRDRFPGSTSPLPNEHDQRVGKNLSIYHLLDHYSIRAKSNPDLVQAVHDESRRAVTEIFGGEPFIYTQNSSDQRGLFNGLSGAHFVSPKAHGLNKYRTFHCAAILGIFNLSADRVGFLKDVCHLDSDTTWNILNNEYAYQFVCRGSLRDVPSAQSIIAPKKVIVMTRPMATYLQEKFPGATVTKFQSSKLDAFQVAPRGRKPASGKAQSDASRKKKSRMKIKRDDLGRKLELLQVEEGQMCHEITLRQQIDIEREWSLTLIGKLSDTSTTNRTCPSFSELASILHKLSERTIEQKDKNRLFNCTRFVEGRKLCNAISSDVILMDMDSDQNCNPKQFAQLISGIEFVAYSSFSSSLERQRWRAVIPLSRPVTSKEYRKIAGELHEICGKNGFPFDKSKKNANDIMYLPGIGQDPSAAFFEHFTGQGRQFLDVDRWLGTSASTEPVPDANRGLMIAA